MLEELIKEIINKFYLTLEECKKLYPNNYKMQIIEMGKAYVKFMVENPEYFKLIYLSDASEPIIIRNNRFFGDEDKTFLIFKNTAEKLFEENSIPKELYVKKILTMWSMVHGIAVIIVNKIIDYDGDFLELIEGVIGTSFE